MLNTLMRKVVLIYVDTVALAKFDFSYKIRGGEIDSNVHSQQNSLMSRSSKPVPALGQNYICCTADCYSIVFY